MGHGKQLNYSYWAKAGFLLGVSLIALGAAGEILGHALFGTLPAWENRLFTYSEGIGLVIGFLSPWIFGVALPLMD